MPPVHDDALQKLADAKAIQDELLDPFETADRIGAELRDALLSFDRGAHRRAEGDAEHAGRVQHRLRALWLQAKEAVEAGNEERVAETALAIRRVSELEFSGPRDESQNQEPKEET